MGERNLILFHSEKNHLWIALRSARSALSGISSALLALIALITAITLVALVSAITLVTLIACVFFVITLHSRSFLLTTGALTLSLTCAAGLILSALITLLRLCLVFYILHLFFFKIYLLVLLI
jgi:hypothetical protein